MLCLLAIGLTASAQTHVLDVNTKKLGAPVQPTMYGIFFEDINYAADGGLYAEMVKNRSFEFPQRLMGWRAFGKFEVRDDGPFERNPHYVRLSSSQVSRTKASSVSPSRRALPIASRSGHVVLRAARVRSR